MSEYTLYVKCKGDNLNLLINKRLNEINNVDKNYNINYININSAFITFNDIHCYNKIFENNAILNRLFLMDWVEDDDDDELIIKKPSIKDGILTY